MIIKIECVKDGSNYHGTMNGRIMFTYFDKPSDYRWFADAMHSKEAIQSLRHDAKIKIIMEVPE